MQSVTPSKQAIYHLIESLPTSQLSEVASFIVFIKMRDEDKLRKDFEALSASSTDFWNNEIDDEVWNNV